MKSGHSRFASLIRSFRRRTIGVLGDFMLDELLRGEATRISPEAPVPVILMGTGQGTCMFPGGAGNVAANLAALGAKVLCFGAVGRDTCGDHLRSLLEERNISCDALVREEGRITPRKLRIVAQQHQVLRLDFEKPVPISSSTSRALIRKLTARAGDLDALIISDYRKGSVNPETASAAVSIAGEHKVPVFIDPKPGQREICRGATCITPNLHEAELLAGIRMDGPAALERAGRQLIQEFKCRYVLITQGGEGMTLIAAASEASPTVHRIPSVARPVYDVTGAGDTVIAVLALAYTSRASMREAAILANLAAGRVVLRFGTAVISSEELLRLVQRPG